MLNRQGTFLDAAEARERLPGLAAGLNYTGRFSDVQAARRLSVVVGFPDRLDGAFEGLLEFLGLPFAGSPLSGCLVAHSTHTARAVLGAQGFAEAPTDLPVLQVAVLLGSTPRWGAPLDPSGVLAFDPSLEAWGLSLCRAAGLSSWALLTYAVTASGYGWRALDAHPDLDPAGPFLRSLAASDAGSGAVMAHVIDEATHRFDGENSLRQRYKDGI